MSTFSLPRLPNGNDSTAASDRRKINHNKFASLRNNRKSASFADAYFNNKYDMAKRDGFVPLQRCESDFGNLNGSKSAINRNGTIGHHQFRGIKRAQLERQTRIFLYSMTVGILFFVSSFCRQTRTTGSNYC